MISDRFRIINPNDLEDYHDQAGDITEASWPEFMLHDPIAGEHWHELFDRFNARALTITSPGKRMKVYPSTRGCESMHERAQGSSNRVTKR